MKKYLNRMIACLMALTLMFVFVSCDSKDENKTPDNMQSVVQLDLNPSIEFCLDEEGKVVSVTALNDDGAVLISGEVFIGEEIEEAVKKYFDLAKEAGYIIEEKAGQIKDTIKVQISGAKETADYIFNTINEEVSKAIEDAKLNIELQKEYLTADNIKAKLQECYADLDFTSMTDEEMVEKLTSLREEVKDIASPIMQSMYYMFENYDEIIAEAKALIAQIEEGTKGTLAAVATAAVTLPLSGVITSMETSFAAVKKVYQDNILSSESAYQQQLDKYFEAKEEYLEARKELAAATDETLKTAAAQTLATVQGTLAVIETAYNQAVTAAELLIKAAKDACDLVVNNVKEAIETLKNNETVKQYFTEEGIKAEIEKTMKDYSDTFTTTYTKALEDYTKAFENASEEEKN